MPVRSTLFTLFLAASLSAGAEVHTLTGKEIKGTVAALTAKEIVIEIEGGGEERIPVEQVLDVVFDKPAPRDKFILVELVDGSQLVCSKAELHGKEVKATLQNGQEVTFDQLILKYILNDAHDAAVAKQWQESVLSVKQTTDIVARSQNGRLNPIQGTFGDADNTGKTVGFTLIDGKTSMNLNLSRMQGMLYLHGPAPNTLPLLCRAYDASGNVLMVGAAAKNGETFTFTTTVGVKIDATAATLVRLDYSRGKLSFLSDLTPVKVVHSTTEGFPQNYRKDVNLDGGPLKMGARTYRKGLALHAHTEVEYDLNGDYREFKADVGFDSQVGGTDGPIILIVEGDGKELRSLTIDRSAMTVPAEDLTVNIKDVNRLKIIVKSGTLLDLGKHLDLGNAKVTK